MSEATSFRQIRAYRSQLRISEAAMDIVRTSGWAKLTIAGVAADAGVSVGLVCRHFPTRDHFALHLYEELADALSARVADLPEGTLVERFATLMRWKLDLLAPHRAVLLAIASVAIDPAARAGVLGAPAQRVRAKVAGLFDVAVQGATDAPEAGAAERVGRLLYAAHLAVVLLWLQLPEGTSLPIELVASAGATLGPFVDAGARHADETLRALLGTPTLPDTGARAAAVLDLVLRRSRTLEASDSRSTSAMRALHLPGIQTAIERDGPIQIALPAFPAKAPNPKKVLGKHPDMAEWLALRSLLELLDEITAVYPPGAELILCSDGGVFADLVGVSDTDVRAYRHGLEAMLAHLEGGHRVRIFDLDDALGGRSAAANRSALLARYAGSVEDLRARAGVSPSTERMVNGIHRFLFEDEVVRAPELSRTQARKATHARAFEVVVRSEAWGALVASAFPDALRCSIHPQPPISNKVGLHLVDTDDAWLTPWHACAVLIDESFRLMHRSDAERLGARRALSEDGLAFLQVSP